MASVAKTFRMPKDTWDRLQAAAEARGKTLTEVLRELIDTLDDDGEKKDSNTQADACATQALAEQLAAKDEQIARLHELLGQAQQTAQAAQALHARDAAALAAEPSGGRLKRAWRALLGRPE